MKNTEISHCPESIRKIIKTEAKWTHDCSYSGHFNKKMWRGLNPRSQMMRHVSVFSTRK
jgi:hypothetical protein